MTNHIRLTEKPNLFLVPLAATTLFCLSTFATLAYSGVPSASVIIETVNTAGTIRTNSQANFEAMLLIMANAFEIFGIAYGITRGVWGVKIGREGNREAAAVIFGSVVIIILAVGLPISVEWLVASGQPTSLW